MLAPDWLAARINYTSVKFVYYLADGAEKLKGVNAMCVNEEWRDIPGYENLYMISNYGKVWSCRSKKLLKAKCNKGYLRIGLHKDGKQKDYFVHRLVAIVFIPNEEAKPEVNHIDEDKKNNCTTNLEWVSAKENTNHGTRNNRISDYVKAHPIVRKQKKMVAQIEKSTGEILRIYGSSVEAARANGFHQGNISSCCNGNRNEANGFKWRYVS